MRSVEFLIPGDPDTATGGYVYDRRITAGLRNLGWTVRVHALDASFPHPGAGALAHADGVLRALPEDALVLIDGLALGAMPRVVERHAERLQLTALVHHPLCAETGLPAEERNRLRQSEIEALAAVRHIVTTSGETRAALLEMGIGAGRVSVVEPGTDRAAPGEVALRQTSEPQTLRLLCIATLTPRKGHALLLEALAPLSRLPWHLVCAGSLERSPATTQNVLERIAALGLEDRVSLLGETDDARLARELSLADLFVLPTLYEGYGMVVAEALRAGVPVVATDTGAIGRLLAGGAGILVPPGDVPALSAALSRAIGEPQVLRELAAHARTQGASLPEWSGTCARMAEILEGLSGSAASR